MPTSKKIALLGIFSALTITLSIIETLVFQGLHFAIPGVKPGLSNIAVLLALYYLDAPNALIISLIKSCTAFLVSGALTMLWFSLAGSLLCIPVMWLLFRFFKNTFTFCGISAAGGVFFNLGQILIMALLSSTSEFFYYLPILAITGAGFGFLTGIIANLITKKFKQATHSPQ